MRARAEDILGKSEETQLERSIPELRRVVHELSIHQIELRMQNEQLRATEQELSAAYDRYFELFDLAPIGYAVLDPRGTVSEANLRLAEWLGRPRCELVGKPFSTFLDRREMTSFARFRRALFEGDSRVSLELNLLTTPEGVTLPVSLEAVRITPAVALVAVLDVSAERCARKLEQRFTEELLELRERDSERIAMELHDGIGQSLSALSVGLRALEDAIGPDLVERLKVLRELVAEASRGVRGLSRRLYRPAVNDLGLGPVLESLVRDTRAATTMNVILELPPTGLLELPNRASHLIYSAAREGLANALHHAGATELTIEVSRELDAVVLEVRDDGRGFDPSQEDDAHEGLGLRSLAYRARGLGGELKVESKAGQGTTLTLRLPMGSS